MKQTTDRAEDYRRLRIAVGLTQSGLADRLGVTGNTVARRERGEVPVTREIMLALERVVGLETERPAPKGRRGPRKK